MEEQEILLESGTNELEILELMLGNQSYGINALKVLKIAQYDESQITLVPKLHPSIIGNIRILEKSIPLVHLQKHLYEDQPPSETERPIVLLTKINSAVNAFLVDGFRRIHRVYWTDIQPPPMSLSMSGSEVTGIATLPGRDILMLDFESIITTIFGDMSPNRRSGNRGADADADARKSERGRIKLLLADDSIVIREGIAEKLEEAQYTNHRVYTNGQELYEAYLEIKREAEKAQKPITDYVQIVVTDIEMPVMDGLTLCKKIKESSPEITVIILSSMVNEQMEIRCRDVHADGSLAKSEIYKLIGLMDQFGTVHH
ncbi:MAG: chemotaxis protein CheV [SAR324 cluster bacterium]|nr:chemotaxis protein CheV [SAR324 cluster bacterium]